MIVCYKYVKTLFIFSNLLKKNKWSLKKHLKNIVVLLNKIVISIVIFHERLFVKTF